MKTFSEKPAGTAAPAADGWKAATPERVTQSPPQPEAYRAEKPADTGSLSRIEPIPSAAAAEPSATVPDEGAPTIAPVGPAVEPAPPVHDPRDVPAAGTSGTGFLRPIPSNHTT
jgi:hypothetical protein